MYTEQPLNYSEIAPYVSEDISCIATALEQQQKLFFYDACALRKHAALSRPEPLLSFFLQSSCVVVITRGILMELASNSQTLQPGCISYIRTLHDAGISVSIIYEEDIFSLLDNCFSSSLQINTFLFLAVTTTKLATGAIEKALNATPALNQNLLVNLTADRNLFRLFFSSIRQSKEPDDNLGEELLTVCVHLLANLPSCREYQFIILTEDKGALFLITKASNNSCKHLEQRHFSAITTPRLTQRLYSIGLLNSEQVLTLLSSDFQGETIRILGSGPYHLTPQHMTFSPAELAQQITTPDALHIHY